MSLYSKALNWRPSHNDTEPATDSATIAHPNLFDYLRMVWESWQQNLSTKDEPHIWQTRDRNGDVLWNAYDPVTDRSLYYASEAEVRIWLENRYSYRAI